MMCALGTNVISQMKQRFQLDCIGLMNCKWLVIPWNLGRFQGGKDQHANKEWASQRPAFLAQTDNLPPILAICAVSSKHDGLNRRAAGAKA